MSNYACIGYSSEDRKFYWKHKKESEQFRVRKFYAHHSNQDSDDEIYNDELKEDNRLKFK